MSGSWAVRETEGAESAPPPLLGRGVALAKSDEIPFPSRGIAAHAGSPGGHDYDDYSPGAMGAGVLDSDVRELDAQTGSSVRQALDQKRSNHPGAFAAPGSGSILRLVAISVSLANSPSRLLLFSPNGHVFSSSPAYGAGGWLVRGLHDGCLLTLINNRGVAALFLIPAACLLAMPVGALSLICFVSGTGGPVLVMALLIGARELQFFQRLLNDTLQEPHFLYLQAAGVRRSRILFAFALPQLLPQSLALLLRSILTGIGLLIPVEVIFDLPGLGQLAWLATMNRDMPVLLAVTMIFACMPGAFWNHGRLQDGTCQSMRRSKAVWAIALLMLLAAAVLARPHASWSAQDRDQLLAPPSTTHPAGTDTLGRDRLTRMSMACLLSLVRFCHGCMPDDLAGSHGGRMDRARTPLRAGTGPVVLRSSSVSAAAVSLSGGAQYAASQSSSLALCSYNFRLFCVAELAIRCAAAYRSDSGGTQVPVDAAGTGSRHPRPLSTVSFCRSLSHSFADRRIPYSACRCSSLPKQTWAFSALGLVSLCRRGEACCASWTTPLCSQPPTGAPCHWPS